MAAGCGLQCGHTRGSLAVHNPVVLNMAMLLSPESSQAHEHDLLTRSMLRLSNRCPFFAGETRVTVWVLSDPREICASLQITSVIVLPVWQRACWDFLIFFPFPVECSVFFLLENEVSFWNLPISSWTQRHSGPEKPRAAGPPWDHLGFCPFVFIIFWNFSAHL